MQNIHLMLPYAEFDFAQKLMQPALSPFMKKILKAKVPPMPAVVELDPTTVCNLNCPYCISKPCMEQSASISMDLFINLFDTLQAGGTLAIILIGGGEPLLHPNSDDIIYEITNRSMRLGVTTNGTQLFKYAEPLKRADWVRVSLNAASEKTFRAVSLHRKGKNYFSWIIKGIENVVKGSSCKIGWSFLILEKFGLDNTKDIVRAAKIARDIGCDYIEYKPMMKATHQVMYYTKEMQSRISDQLVQAKEFENCNFRVVFSNSLRWILDESAHELILPKSSKCHMTNLRTVITPTGCYICPYHRGNIKFNYGMLNRATSFEELWNSPKRKYLMNKHDKLVDCNFFCIRDETNQLIDHWLEGGIPEISDTVNDLFI